MSLFSESSVGGAPILLLLSLVLVGSTVLHGPRAFTSPGESRGLPLGADALPWKLPPWRRSLKHDGEAMPHGPAHLVGDIFTGSDSHPTQMHPCGALLCFQATDATHGAELWSSTGLEGGSQMVRDIAPGAAGSRPAEFIAWKGKLYFAADDGVHGKELWVTDGTSEGTLLVKDINPGTDGSNCMKTAIDFGDVLLFVADDGEHGNELWRTDGTDAGTSLLLDIWPVSAAQAASNPNSGLGNPNGFLVAFDKLWFSATDGTGYELWCSDGTAVGTQLVMDINTNPPNPEQPPGSTPHGLVALGDVIVFVADDGVHGMELWTHNPQTSTTSLLLDIQPNTASGVPGALINGPGGMAYFSGDDGVHGVELWRTDGTAAGTTMVADLHPGEASSTVLRAQTSAILDGRLFYAEGQAPNVQLMATCVNTFCLPTQIGPLKEEIKRVITWEGQLLLLTLSRILVSQGQDNSGFDVKAPCSGDTLTIGQATTTLVPVLGVSDSILFFAAEDSRHGVELHALLASRLQDHCPPLPETPPTVPAPVERLPDAVHVEDGTYDAAPILIAIIVAFAVLGAVVAYVCHKTSGAAQQKLITDPGPPPGPSPAESETEMKQSKEAEP